MEDASSGIVPQDVWKRCSMTAVYEDISAIAVEILTTNYEKLVQSIFFPNEFSARESVYQAVGNFRSLETLYVDDINLTSIVSCFYKIIT